MVTLNSAQLHLVLGFVIPAPIAGEEITDWLQYYVNIFWNNLYQDLLYEWKIIMYRYVHTLFRWWYENHA